MSSTIADATATATTATTSTSITLRGHLGAGQSTGTVALINSSTDEVIAVSVTNELGWFSFPDIPAADLRLFGIPGEEMSEADMKAAIAEPPAVHYEAIVPAGNTDVVYLNGVSSIVSARLRLLSSSNAADIADQVKDHLFGKGASLLLPGYPSEFIAHLAPPAVFSPRAFLSEAASEGGVAALASKVAAELNANAPGRVRFADAAESPSQQGEDNGMQAGLVGSPPPDIKASANWSSASSSWTATMGAKDKAAAKSSKGLGDMLDGLSASFDKTIAEFSFNDLASWAGGKIKDKVVAFITGQVFGYLEEWIFGKPKNPVLEALKQISEQLNTIITNQVTMINMLSAIMAKLLIIQKDIITLSLTPAISSIQSAAKTVYENASATTKGMSEADLDTLTANIIEPLHGIPAMLQTIHNVITGGSGATPLVSSVLECCIKPGGVKGLNQNFLSNENCYMTAQNLFQFHATIQSQGVQLLVQAHNYRQNKNIKDLDTKLPSSPLAKAVYDTWMIGGKGSTGQKPNLEQQRDLYRTKFEQYYKDFQGYMGALPDDIAVCPIPEAEGQVVPVFYSVESKFLVLGVISYTLRNWTKEKNALAAQKACTASNSWAFAESLKPNLRFPSSEELKSILGAGYTNTVNYNGNYYSYLKDQGLSHDFDKYKITGADNYGANVVVWVTDTQSVGKNDDWGWNNGGGEGPGDNPYPPYQTNGAECVLTCRSPRYQWWYEGNVAKCMQLENNGGASRMNLTRYSTNGFDPNTNSGSWTPLGMKWLYYTRVNGGWLIIDPKTQG